jgi:hypothetical protein
MASARVFLMLALIAMVLIATQVPLVEAARELRGAQDKTIISCKTYGAVACGSATAAPAMPECTRCQRFGYAACTSLCSTYSTWTVECATYCIQLPEGSCRVPAATCTDSHITCPAVASVPPAGLQACSTVAAYAQHATTSTSCCLVDGSAGAGPAGGPWATKPYEAACPCSIQYTTAAATGGTSWLTISYNHCYQC